MSKRELLFGEFRTGAASGNLQAPDISSGILRCISTEEVKQKSQIRRYTVYMVGRPMFPKPPVTCRGTTHTLMNCGDMIIPEIPKYRLIARGACAQGDRIAWFLRMYRRSAVYRLYPEVCPRFWRPYVEFQRRDVRNGGIQAVGFMQRCEVAEA